MINLQVSNNNENWTLTVKMERESIYIMHDAQRDRDGVHLSLEEWEFVKQSIDKLFRAKEAAEREINV